MPTLFRRMSAARHFEPGQVVSDDDIERAATVHAAHAAGAFPEADDEPAMPLWLRLLTKAGDRMTLGGFWIGYPAGVVSALLLAWWLA